MPCDEMAGQCLALHSKNHVRDMSTPDKEGVIKES